MTKITVLHYGYCLKNFLTYLAGKDPAEVNKEILRDFIEYLKAHGKSQKTIENYFSVLFTFYELLTCERPFWPTLLPALVLHTLIQKWNEKRVC